MEAARKATTIIHRSQNPDTHLTLQEPLYSRTARTGCASRARYALHIVALIIANINIKGHQMKNQFLSSVGAAVVLLLGLCVSLSVAAEPEMVEKTIYIPGSGEVYKVMVAPEKIDQTIYYGGDIVTMDGEKPVYVEAAVEKGGKIAFAGTKDEAFNRFRENSFEVDLEGKTMLPGFLDPHSHFRDEAEIKVPR